MIAVQRWRWGLGVCLVTRLSCRDKYVNANSAQRPPSEFRMSAWAQLPRERRYAVCFRETFLMCTEKSFAFENIIETPIFELLLFRSIPAWLCLRLSVNGALHKHKSLLWLTQMQFNSPHNLGNVLAQSRKCSDKCCSQPPLRNIKVKFARQHVT